MENNSIIMLDTAEVLLGVLFTACGIVCMNDATLNATECKCNCQFGWQGDDCNGKTKAVISPPRTYSHAYIAMVRH